MFYCTYHKQHESLFLNNSTAAEERNKEDDGTTGEDNKNSSGIEVVANDNRHKVTINSHIY